MASAGRHDLPVYPLADIQPRTRRMLLAPAIRWRVIVEQVSEIKHDIILETVLQIRDAGEKLAPRIADRLQLPEDLVRHLLAQAATEGMRVSHDGELQTSSSRVAWVYRDIATGELWPDPGDEVPPLAVRFRSSYQAQFDRGSAGRPNFVKCLLLDTPETTVAEPTSVELARFSRASSDPNRRTAIVSSGEPCLVASPVVGQAAGCFVETTRGVPHVSLTQQLAKAGQQYPGVSRWLASVPKAPAPKGGELPLRRALAELRDVTADRTSGECGSRSGRGPEPHRPLPQPLRGPVPVPPRHHRRGSRRGIRDRPQREVRPSCGRGGPLAGICPRHGWLQGRRPAAWRLRRGPLHAGETGDSRRPVHCLGAGTGSNA